MEKPNQLISPAITNQIASAQEYLLNHPLFSLTRAHAECRELKRNANRHSVEMEMPPRTGHHKYERRKGMRNLTDAQKYMLSSLRKDPRLSEELLRKTAANIHGYEGAMIYREVSAFANKYNYQYEDPSEISNQVFLFVEENNGLRNILERALHAHFHIARIHPFCDGNGRLARLTANNLNSIGHLPPVQVYPFERKRYCDLINAAQREYREVRGMGEAQRTFYDYLAMKVKYSIDKIGEAILH